MNKYAIYCTKEQTCKSFELGAPLDFRNGDRPFISVKYFDEDGKLFYHNYDIPTAEEMLGWLEEKDGIYDIHLLRTADDEWKYEITTKHLPKNKTYGCCKSRKEATIAAIDAALEYLMNNKEE